MSHLTDLKAKRYDLQHHGNKNDSFVILVQLIYKNGLVLSAAVTDFEPNVLIGEGAHSALCTHPVLSGFKKLVMAAGSSDFKMNK